MNWTRLALIVILTTCPAWADQVSLKNGDRITGSIVKKDGANLVIKSAAAGTITVPWDQVDSIASEGALNIVFADRTVQAPLTMSSGGRVLIQGNAVNTTDIVAIRNADEQRTFERLQHPGWGQLWLGNAALTFGGSTGNSETKSFLVGVNAARATRTDTTSLYFTAIKSSAQGIETAQAVRAGWAYKKDVAPKLFVTAFNDWETNRFQQLDLRFVLGGGFGYHAWKNSKGFLDFVGGADYARDRFGLVPATPSIPAVPAHTDSRGELFYGDDFGYKLSARTTFTQSWRMFHDFSDFGAYRLNFDATAATRINSWLTWNATVSDRYLAVPPDSLKSNDFIYSTGIGVTFAR